MASNQFSLTGEVLFVGDVVQVKETFRKRDLVIEVPDGNYPQPVKFQATQDRCQVLDNVRTGQTITVHFNIRGNHSPILERASLATSTTSTCGASKVVSKDHSHSRKLNQRTTSMTYRSDLPTTEDALRMGDSGLLDVNDVLGLDDDVRTRRHLKRALLFGCFLGLTILCTLALPLFLRAIRDSDSTTELMYRRVRKVRAYAQLTVAENAGLHRLTEGRRIDEVMPPSLSARREISISAIRRLQHRPSSVPTADLEVGLNGSRNDLSYFTEERLCDFNA
ncbi:MAG: DUF3127 domain-containing protein [Ignavibacteria bacterium]|nr:DUF3127 domain-containing protein [Ignavibacteria bacterium]